MSGELYRMGGSIFYHLCSLKNEKVRFTTGLWVGTGFLQASARAGFCPTAGSGLADLPTCTGHLQRKLQICTAKLGSRMCRDIMNEDRLS